MLIWVCTEQIQSKTLKIDISLFIGKLLQLDQRNWIGVCFGKVSRSNF